jgi:hypothetical protein
MDFACIQKYAHAYIPTSSGRKTKIKTHAHVKRNMKKKNSITRIIHKLNFQDTYKTHAYSY